MIAVTVTIKVVFLTHGYFGLFNRHFFALTKVTKHFLHFKQVMMFVIYKKGSMGNKVFGGQTVLIIVMRAILHIILITLDLGVAM